MVMTYTILFRAWVSVSCITLWSASLSSQRGASSGPAL